MQKDFAMTNASIITISGALGSGKSTLMKMLAERLGFETYSTGKAQRAIAQRYGVSTLELNHMADSNPAIDQEIDGVFKTLVDTGKNYVVDSRLAFFFIPSSFKVKLNVSISEAARRVFNDTERTSEVSYQNVLEAEKTLIQRRISEVNRFEKIYDVNIDDDTHFDLVIDTTDKTPEAICQMIIQGYQKNIG